MLVSFFSWGFSYSIRVCVRFFFFVCRLCGWALSCYQWHVIIIIKSSISVIISNFVIFLVFSFSFSFIRRISVFQLMLRLLPLLLSVLLILLTISHFGQFAISVSSFAYLIFLHSYKILPRFRFIYSFDDDDDDDDYCIALDIKLTLLYYKIIITFYFLKSFTM